MCTWSQSSRSAGYFVDHASSVLPPRLLERDPALVLVDALAHRVGDVEPPVRIPAERLLRRAHLVLAERSAVRLRSVDCVRRAVRDVRADDDRATDASLSLRARDRGTQRIEVVGVVDVLDVPALRLEALPRSSVKEIDVVPSIVMRLSS